MGTSTDRTIVATAMGRAGSSGVQSAGRACRERSARQHPERRSAEEGPERSGLQKPNLIREWSGGSDGEIRSGGGCLEWRERQGWSLPSVISR